MFKTCMKTIKRAVAPIALLTLIGFSPPASAFQPLVTDDTGTQGTGGNQLELSFNQYRAMGPAGTDQLLSLPVGYTRGLTETLDVFAGFRYIQIRSSTSWGDASGSGNPSFGAKWRFYENDGSKTSFAIKPEVFFPVSSVGEGSGLGTGKASGNLTLVLTQEVPFGAIHVNAGAGRYRWRDSLTNPDTTTACASISPVWDNAEQWKLALDMGVESASAGDVKIRSRFVELGAIYSPSKELDVALGVLRVSFNQSAQPATQVATAAITWRFR